MEDHTQDLKMFLEINQFGENNVDKTCKMINLTTTTKRRCYQHNVLQASDVYFPFQQ